MPGSNRVAAVVVTFNRLELLQRLLERLDGVDGLDEVIVIDNASHAAIEEQPETISRALIDFANRLWPRST